MPKVRLAAAPSLVAVLLTAGTVLAGPWPDEPPFVPGTPAEPGFLYSAGLYRSLTELGGYFPEPGLRMLRLRAFLAQGDGESALRELEEGLTPPRDLALMLRLEEASPWQDLQGDYWRRRLEGQDGESLYWRARLEMGLGDPSAARQPLETLLRRHPGSAFAPAAQELLAGLPEFGAGSLEPPSDAEAGACRIQWGVFRDAARARRQVAVLEAYGSEAHILSFERDGQPLHRVVSGAYADRDEARAQGERMRQRYGLDFVLYAEDAAP